MPGQIVDCCAAFPWRVVVAVRAQKVLRVITASLEPEGPVAELQIANPVMRRARVFQTPPAPNAFRVFGRRCDTDPTGLCIQSRVAAFSAVAPQTDCVGGDADLPDIAVLMPGAVTIVKPRDAVLPPFGPVNFTVKLIANGLGSPRACDRGPLKESSIGDHFAMPATSATECAAPHSYHDVRSKQTEGYVR